MSDRALAAVAWLDTQIARNEAEQLNADAFVVVTRDPEFGDTGVNGPFTDWITALAWAQAHATSLNAGLADGDEPWEVFVKPLDPPS